MGSTADAAKRLWNLCNVLRDDGITYHQYISELTLILFLSLPASLAYSRTFQFNTDGNLWPLCQTRL